MYRKAERISSTSLDWKGCREAGDLGRGIFDGDRLSRGDLGESASRSRLKGRGGVVGAISRLIVFNGS